MKRGRPPKSRDFRVLEGNAGRRPLPEPDPETEELGYVPRHLLDAEKETWRRLRDQVTLLKKADSVLVEIFCRTFVLMDRTERRLLQLVEANSPDLRRMTVLERTATRARDHCLRLLAQMGATPTARIRVMRKPDEEGPGDDVEKKFFGT